MEPEHFCTSFVKLSLPILRTSHPVIFTHFSLFSGGGSLSPNFSKNDCVRRSENCHCQFCERRSFRMKQNQVQLTLSMKKEIAAITRSPVHPHLLDFWRLAQLYQWKPIKCQDPVSDPSLNVRTCADCVVEGKDREDSILEVKLGFHGSYYKKHTPVPMKAIGLNDSLANQHHLQLGMTAELYRRTHPTRNVSETNHYILRFHDEGVEMIPLASWFRNQKHVIVQQFKK